MINRKQKLSFFRHIKSHQTLWKLILDGKVKGQRYRRQKRSWENDVENCMGAIVWESGTNTRRSADVWMIRQASNVRKRISEIEEFNSNMYATFVRVRPCHLACRLHLRLSISQQYRFTKVCSVYTNRVILDTHGI